MMEFTGFPEKSQFTAVPNVFFSSLLPRIDDLNELKLTLIIIEILYRKRGSPRFVSFKELSAHPVVVNSIKAECETSLSIHSALDKMVTRSTVLQVSANTSGGKEEIYLLNNPGNRRIIVGIMNGEVKIPEIEIPIEPPRQPDSPDIFTLYEENIGLITPVIAEELRDAEQQYPADWIRDALKEAVDQNKRSWKYASRILERWAREGKNDGTHRRYSATDTDPDKYVRGKYGHMVRR